METIRQTVLQTAYREFQGQIESCKLQDMLNSTLIDIMCSPSCETTDCILLQTSDWAETLQFLHSMEGTQWPRSQRYKKRFSVSQKVWLEKEKILGSLTTGSQFNPTPDHTGDPEREGMEGLYTAQSLFFVSWCFRAPENITCNPFLLFVAVERNVFLSSPAKKKRKNAWSQITENRDYVWISSLESNKMRLLLCMKFKP